MRQIVELDQGWLFSKTCTKPPEEIPLSNDWTPIKLPHTWNAVDGQIGTPYYRGACWYVTEFEVPNQPLPGGRTYIEVGAAQLKADVYVNGKLCGSHSGGYSAFRVDVTEACKETGKNLLAILVDNSYSDKIYPQRADFTFYGGLYRHVRIISVSESHISLDYFGSSGLFVDTCSLDGSPSFDNGAVVKFKVRLSNWKANQTVGIEIFDKDGVKVGEAWTFASDIAEAEVFVHNPHLWRGTKDPCLYTAKVTLLSFNEVLDEIVTHFGIRSFSVDKEQGFILNGKPYPLRGVCRHQDRLYKGNALTREDHFEDAKIIADMGANCVRLAHYQQSHDIYEACDRLGLVVWAEIPYFTSSWDDDAHRTAVNEIKEMCAQNYNHPSICFWGLSNEILMGQDHPKLLKCHEDLAEAVRSIDTTRLTVIAHEYNTPWDHKIHDISDVEGWNHYFGWYRGQLSDLEKWLDEYHSKYPDRLISVSEYGCDAILTYHSDTPEKLDYTEEYQARLHEHACEVFAKRQWIWGTFVWNMFDFGSSFRREGGTRGRNNKGLVTMDRKIKKDSYYVYKAWYSDEPFVHIAGRRYAVRQGTETEIRVYSNQSEVTLYVNGEPLQTQKGNHVFVFPGVPLNTNGSTYITAKAGDCTDSITLRSISEKPDLYTYPEFRERVDARNWFNSLEEFASTLEAPEGYYSVHDKMSDLSKSKEARQIIHKAIMVILERNISEERLFATDNTPFSLQMDMTLEELFTAGRLFSVVAQEKREQGLKRINALLNKIKKQ